MHITFSIVYIIQLVAKGLVASQGYNTRADPEAFLGGDLDKTEQPINANQDGSLLNQSGEKTEELLKPILPLNLVAEQTCSLPVRTCNESKYRTINGSCNNLNNPKWGTPNSRYARLLPPKYSDGVVAPPVSVTGEDLPSSRLLSYVLFPDANVPDPEWTLNAMQWGQLIAHDLSLTAGVSETNFQENLCCSNGKINKCYNKARPRCLPIKIPFDDPFYSKFNLTCMNFIRTLTDLDAGCSPPQHPAEQLSSVTAYMDASLIYGSSTEVSLTIRESKGGRFKVELVDGRPFPPQAANKLIECDVRSEDEPCYQFGDVRGNQNPQLTVLQLVLLREHNRLATTLQQLNPHWDDEKLYQEARRILIAEFQYINYYEWLPIFIGSEIMIKRGLIYPEAKGYIEDYKEEIDPSIINSYATAAFRYFHSGIQGHLQLVEENRQSYEAVLLSYYFNRPFIIQQKDNFDSLARGLCTQHQQTDDKFFTTQVTNWLFASGRPFGGDLRAITIQRGRDHGLASYNDFRQFCELPKGRTFEDFADYITPEENISVTDLVSSEFFPPSQVIFCSSKENVRWLRLHDGSVPHQYIDVITILSAHSDKNIEKLKSLYAHPDDVDLAVGGSLEGHINETLSGPTNLCLIVEQFYRTRVSDRFFFERGKANPGAFTPEQLNEIRKSSVSRIMCDNGDNIHSIQPSGFRVISKSNVVVPCEDTNKIPVIDLSLWKEEILVQQ